MTTETKNDVILVDNDAYFEKMYHHQEKSYESHSQKMASMYEQYLEVAAEKLLAPFSDDIIDLLEKLKEKFPNARQIIADIEAQVYLQKNNKLNYSKLNSVILIVGEPGCGKTEFSNALIKALSPFYYQMNLSMYSEAFQLAGLSMGYGSGGPGLISQFIRDSDYANFFVFVDEFDKGAMVSKSRSSAYIPMYNLLEKNSAKSFEDIALNLELDASYISWIVTTHTLHY